MKRQNVGGVTARPRSRFKEALISLGLIAGSIVFTLIVLEVVLRFMPVSTGLASVAVNAQNPVFHFAPNRDTLYSMGWDMHNVVRSHVNNAGFVNQQDYVRDDPRPMIAIVGDSFIEAQMVPYADTVQGRLARDLAGRFRVYSFAASGAPFSQYLIWAQHAVQAYSAHAVVINVVGNDFDESLNAYRVAPGFWLYSPDSGGTLQLRLNEHRPGWLTTLVRHSSLGRYIVINLSVSGVLFDVRAIGDWVFGKPAQAATPRVTKLTSPNTDPVRVRDSLAAIDAFFRDLPKRVELPKEDVLLMVDGFRYRDLKEMARGIYFDVMRRAFIEKARKLGYEAVDLDDMFIPRNEETSELFEFSDDAHWNGAGHGVAAEAVMSSRMLAHLRQ